MAGRNLSDVAEMIIVQGGTYEGGFSLADETGQALDTTWRGRLEIRDSYGGDLLTAMAESGEDGFLTINAAGQALVTLPSAVTEALPTTADSLGLNDRSFVGELELWNVSTPSLKYKPETPFRVFVRPEVTTA